MKLKNYLLLDCKNSDAATPTLTVKLVKGFTAKNVGEQFDIQSSWTPRGDGTDNIFCFSGCTIPRFKVRKKWTTTIKPSNATVMFIDPDKLLGSESTFNMYPSVAKVPTEKLLNFLAVLKDERVKILANSLYPQCSDILLTKKFWEDANHIKSMTIDDSSLYDHDICRWRINGNYESCNKTHLYTFSPDSDLFNVDFEKVPVCHADAILPFLNEDKMVIDEKKYEELCSLGNSSQQEDVVVMMELMANSDYKKSLPYLLGLFQKFRTQIANQNEVNHVNFKSLMNYCNLKPSDLSYNLNLQALINILKARNQFTKENALLMIILMSEADGFDN